MKTRSYYSFADTEASLAKDTCSRASDSAPLIVNCAGNFNTSYPFTTESVAGRADYYLMYITSGTLSVMMPQGMTAATAGDTVVFPPTYRYMYTYSGGESLNYMWAHFTGSAAEFYLKEMSFLPLPCIRHSARESRGAAMFESMFEIFSREDPLRPHALAACLLRVLTELGREAMNDRQSLIRRSLRYIGSSYTENIDIRELAAMENLSPSRYYALFKEIMGKPPRNYIIGLRMRHACELLRNTDMNVKQIGLTVGYGDPHFFSKLFKANMGQSPTEYRTSVSIASARSKTIGNSEK